MKGSPVSEKTLTQWTVEEVLPEPANCASDGSARLVRLSPSGSYDFNELEVGQVLVVKGSA
jgi:hypothetical protein